MLPFQEKKRIREQCAQRRKNTEKEFASNGTGGYRVYGLRDGSNWIVKVGPKTMSRGKLEERKEGANHEGGSSD